MEKYYMAAMGYVKGLGHKGIALLIKIFGSATSAWTINPKDLFSAKIRHKAFEAFVNFRRENPDAPEKLISYCDKHKINLCSIFDEDYPAILKEIDSPPLFFYYRGKLEPTVSRIGIVGSRNNSGYGEVVASELGEELAAAGLTVVSGAARGIDTFAHNGALKSCRTVAVLGCGLDCNFPHERRKFLDRIAENGVVLSEFNLHSTPTKGTFVYRNRIIAGLCKGVIVVEADLKSGSMLTANYAKYYGRDLFAVVNSSEGCDKLIRDGAIPVEYSSDVLDKYHITLTE